MLFLYSDRSNDCSEIRIKVMIELHDDRVETKTRDKRESVGKTVINQLELNVMSPRRRVGKVETNQSKLNATSVAREKRGKIRG